MFYAGIDVGSTTTKAVIIEADHENIINRIVGRKVIKTGHNHSDSARMCLEGALDQADVAFSDILNIVGTGYGRNNIPFAGGKSTEIFCHAAGAKFYYPNATTIIDIGGQDSKVIKMGNTGKVYDFSMNEKCAAGTGRFIEVICHVLGLDIKEAGKLSMNASKELSISSMCTVFAESEVISKIANGDSREDILRALNNAIADRVISMGKRIGIATDIVMTGGVARNIGIRKSFEKKLESEVFVPDDPQTVGALGAAIKACEDYWKMN